MRLETYKCIAAGQQIQNLVMGQEMLISVAKGIHGAIMFIRPIAYNPILNPFEASWQEGKSIPDSCWLLVVGRKQKSSRYLLVVGALLVGSWNTGTLVRW